MASDPQTELRLSRLENDSSSLYELVDEIRTTQQEHSRRFDGVDLRFDAVDRHFDAVNGRLDAVDQRFDGVDQRFDGVDQRFDSVDATLAEVLRRLPEPA